MYTIATSMQLSVIPHLTIYGDVTKQDIEKDKLSYKVKDKMGLLEKGSHKAIESGEKGIVEAID